MNSCLARNGGQGEEKYNMRRVFSYVFFLLGLVVMVLSILSIFGFVSVLADQKAWAVGMAAFGLVLCLLGFFMVSGLGGINPDEPA